MDEHEKEFKVKAAVELEGVFESGTRCVLVREVVAELEVGPRERRAASSKGMRGRHAAPFLSSLHQHRRIDRLNIPSSDHHAAVQ